MNKKDYYNCGFELTLELIDGKWKSLILWKLNEISILRYGELSRQIEGITQKMLTQQLKELDKSGLISRKVYSQIPPKVEYSLTPYGKQLCKIFNEMKDFGNTYAKENNIQVLDKL